MRTARANALAGALAVVGFLLYLAPASRGSFWQDEGVSATIAAGSWRDLWHTLRTYDPNMSLYDVLLRFWRLGGTSETWMRSFSALCVGATVFVVYLIATRLQDSKAGLGAAFVLALSPLAVRYGHEARSYGLLALLVAVATLLFVRVVDDPTTAKAVGCGVVTALAAYAHAYALLAALALALSLFLLGRALPPRRILVVLGASYAVAVAPFLLLVATGPPPLIDWINAPNLEALRGVGAEVAGNSVTLLLFAMLLAVVVVAAWRTRRAEGRSLALWSLGLPVLGVFVPPVVALAWTYAVQPVLVTRYLIVCLPALAVVVGIAISFVRRPAVQVALLAVVLVASVVSVRKVLDDPGSEDWKGVAAYVASHAEPGDGVVFCSSTARPTFEYYLLGTPAAGTLVPLSPSTSWGRGTHTERASTTEVARFDTAARIWVVDLGSADPHDAACRLDRSMAGRTATPARVSGAIRVTRYDS